MIIDGLMNAAIIGYFDTSGHIKPIYCLACLGYGKIAAVQHRYWYTGSKSYELMKDAKSVAILWPYYADCPVCGGKAVRVDPDGYPIALSLYGFWERHKAWLDAVGKKVGAI